MTIVLIYKTKLFNDNILIMVTYECKRCGLKTNRETDYNRHLNRKIQCYPNDPHKNTKKYIENFRCDKCDRDFSRKDSLARHNKTYHVEINGNNNNTQIGGDHNNQTNIDQQNNINNPIIHIHTPDIYSYLHNDINDLTLFEQYLSLTSKNSPYTALLDNLNLNPNKPVYHNIHLGNINKNMMDVHNGEKWIKEIMLNALSGIIDTKRIMIQMIFNRFRCFLNKKATHLIPKAFYYGCPQNYYFHKKIVQHIKAHLYNNRNIIPNQNTPKENIPTERTNETWWALTKKFNWKDVDSLLSKMDELKIDLDKNLDEIKIQLTNCIKNKPKLAQFFKTFFKHITKLINEFKLSEKNNDTPDSSSNESDNNESDDIELDSDEFDNNEFDNNESDDNNIVEV